MALRTPPLQTRSQFGRSWGNFASATALPNASGAPLGAPFFSILEVGDTAYSVADGATYTCTSVGTVGGGDAVWSSGGGVVLVDGVRGFSGADYLQAIAGSLPGVAGGFTVALLVRPRRQDVGDETIAGTANNFVNHTGWLFGHLATLGYYFSVGDGASNTQFILGPANTVFANAGKFALLHGVYTAGGEVRGYVNGSRLPGSVPQAFVASGNPCLIGLDPFGILPAEEIDIFGIAYIEQGLDDDECFEHWNACAEAGELVQGALAWDELNTGSLIAGALPSQVGGVSFSEIGALTNTDAPLVWR